MTNRLKNKTYYSILFGISVLCFSGCAQISDNQNEISDGKNLQVIVSFSAEVEESKWVVSVGGYRYSCIGHSYVSEWVDESVEVDIEGISQVSFEGRLNIYDGGNNLIGVPDSYFASRVPTLENCEITFKFSNVNFGDSPIIVRTGSGSQWSIPQSDWQDGVINLDGSQTVF